MIQIKDKVTHAVHGVGTVINTYNNGSICAVDFEGVTRRIETANLQKSKRNYVATDLTKEKIHYWGGAEKLPKEKSQAEQLKDVLVEVQKLQEGYKKELLLLNTIENPNDKALVRIGSVKEFIAELEAILTGKKFEV